MLRPLLRSQTALLGLVFFMSATLWAASDIVSLKNGDTLVGEVKSATDSEIILILKDGSERTLALEELEADCAYRLLSARLEVDDLEGHMKLGDFAMANRYFKGASKEYKLVLKLADEGSELKAKAEECYQKARAGEAVTDLEKLTAGLTEIDKAVKDLKSEQLEKVVRQFTSLQKEIGAFAKKFSDAGLAKEIESLNAIAGELAKTLSAAQAGVQAQELKRRMEEKALELDQRYTEQFTAVEAARDLGAEAERAGTNLQVEGKDAAALASFLEAAKHFSAAREALQALVEKLTLENAAIKPEEFPGDSNPLLKWLDKSEAQGKLLKKKLVSAYESITTSYMKDKNFEQAWVYVNRILSIDPQHEGAQELKREISISISKENREYAEE